MAIPATLIKALAATLHDHAPQGLRPVAGESEEAYVRRVIPAINGELRQGTKLNPLQAGLYDLPRNALVGIAVSVGFDDDDMSKFKKLDHSEMVSQLSRLQSGADTATLDTFYNHIYAAQASVQLFKIAEAPSSGAARHWLKIALGRDVFEGKQPKAVGSQYEITNAVEFDKFTYCLTFSHAVEEQEAVGNDFRITTLTALRHVHLIIDSKKKTAEFRGPMSQAEKVMNIYMGLLADLKQVFTYEKISFDQSDAEALKIALGATGKRVRHVNEGSVDDGLRTVLSTVDPDWTDEQGRNDLFNAPGFQKLEGSLGEDTVVEGWDLKFPFHDKLFTVQVHLIGGSLRFPEGLVTDDVIRHVTKNLHAVLLNKTDLQAKTAS